MNSFKNKNSFNKRKEESDNIKDKYPDRIPIIVQKHEGSELPDIDKYKYLVPKNMSITQFSFIIRKRVNLDSSQAIFITINSKLVGSNKTISEIYHDEQDDDGFLYIVYTGENTFG
jgi:GABA(A) receptor-associated protein